MAEKEEGLRHTDLLSFTTEIVAAHLSGGASLTKNEIPDLIEQVYRTLSGLSGAVSGPVGGERRQPAVSVKKSITPDYIICLEDGKKLKMLKRHLKTAYGMTPDMYRERWNLPANYPMVAPNYAKHRSRLARDIGLGKKALSKAAKRG